MGFWRLFAGLLFILLAVAMGRAAEDESLARVQRAKILKACADLDNLPLSTAEESGPPGLDVEVARAIAGRLGVKAQPVWVDTSAMGRALRLLRTGSCDILVGLPVDRGFLSARPWLDVTIPYYGTGFVLATRQGRLSGATRLADLQAEVIGVEAKTMADYHLHRAEFPRKLYASQALLLQGLERGEVEAALLFAPVAAWFLKERPDTKVHLVLDRPPDPLYRWNVAIGVRKEDRALKEALDGAIQELLANGRIQAILAKYGIPFVPAFK